jgi:hypothetical protein
MPATCVPWNDSTGSNGVFAYFEKGDAGAKVRWTITLGVVNCFWPFGNPAG